MQNSITHAAVAVLQREDGWVLLGKRPEGKPWAGWWEFPGGKIEEGEFPLQALQRELQEELGTQALEAYPWLTRTFDYPEKTVKLHFFRVFRWAPEPHGREGQFLAWQNPSALTVDPMLPANAPILSALQLPSVFAITNLAELGEADFFRRLGKALQGGIQLIQVREKHLSRQALENFARKVIEMSRPYSARVILNAGFDLAVSLGADGVHLSSSQLMTMSSRPAGMLYSASCHDQAELEHARKLGLDFVVLSPVMATLSHPGADALGWQKFAGLIEGYPLPVYALGGMQHGDLATAWQHGAHGIAMQRAAW